MAKHKPAVNKKNVIQPPVALITGGAKRIGAAITQALHTSGMDVIVHYQHSAKHAKTLQQTLNTLRKNSCSIVQADLSVHQELTRLINDVMNKRGHLDALINNASVFYPTPLPDASEEQWHQLLDINLKAPFFLSQLAAPYLRKNKGNIINLIDIHADRPLPDHPIYCASKAGLASLTRSMALSFAPKIRVNGIAPGAILWPENQPDKSTNKQILTQIPLKRLGSTQDVANTVVYLINGTQYITGQIINIDGGRSIAS